MAQSHLRVESKTAKLTEAEKTELWLSGAREKGEMGICPLVLSFSYLK